MDLKSDNQLPEWISDSDKLANLLFHLIRLYQKAEYQAAHERGTEMLPEFIKKALGRPLNNLYSFATYDKDKQKSKGLGIFIDAVHREMRGFAFTLGKMFLETFKEHGIDQIPQPKCPFSHMIGGLEKPMKASLVVKVDNKDLKVKFKGDKAVLRGFSIGAAAGGVYSRGMTDSDAIKPYSGVSFDAYKKAQELSVDVIKSLKSQHPEYERFSNAELGLDLNNKKLIAAKAIETGVNARILYNFFTGICRTANSSYENWVASVEAKPERQRFYMSTPADIASIIYISFREFANSTGYLQENYARSVYKDVEKIIDNIANATNLTEAFAMLNQPLARDILNKMYTASTHKPDLHKVAAVIFELREKAGFSQNISSAPGKA